MGGGLPAAPWGFPTGSPLPKEGVLLQLLTTWLTNDGGRTRGGDTCTSAVCPTRPSEKLRVRPEVTVLDTVLRLGVIKSVLCHSGHSLSLLILKMGMMMNH